MPKYCWNACVVMVAALLWVASGCAKPATTPATTPQTSTPAPQAGSTTGGGAEVPMPAATEETPAEPTLTEPTPAEPTPESTPTPTPEPTPEAAADKPADAPAEKQPE
jgi:cytoskeletal protein RodZ